MNSNSASDGWLTVAIRWVARIWAAALLCFWGAFFVEHTAEWFLHPRHWPPPWVVALHCAHFAFLVGLIVGWRWELTGGVISVTAAILFFSQVSGKHLPLFLGISVVPGVLWIGLSQIKRHFHQVMGILPAQGQ